MRKLNSLQAGRAAAALAVLLYHITIQIQDRNGYMFAGGAFMFGYTGIDFFFVLSGFIIYYAHARDIGQHSSLPHYAARRFIRIYPFYWVIFGVVLLSMVVAPGAAGSEGSGPAYLIKSALLIPQPIAPLITPAWTLSYEVLFYVLFGVGLWFGWRTAVAGALVWGALIVLFAPALFPGIRAPFQGSPAVFWLNFLFSDHNMEFLLGCVAAALVVRRTLHTRWLQAALIIGLLWLVGWAIYVDLYGPSAVASYGATFGVASFLIVLGLAGLELGRPTPLPGGIVFLGDASYSIYLIQGILLSLFFLLIGRTGLGAILHPFWIACLGIAFVLVGGSVCYVFVERPLLKTLQRSWLRRATPSKTIQPAV